MGRTSTVERSVVVAAPVEEVFAFHLDTRNAALISPRSLAVVDVQGVFPVTEGAHVVMRLRPRPSPVTQTWRVRIAAVEPHSRIVDVGERTPFASWHHEHLFRAVGPGRTEMTDRITYGLPGGPFGALADRLVVRRLMRSSLEERHARTRELLEGAGR